MLINLKQVSFGRYGSYFGILELEKSSEREKGLYLRTVQKDAMTLSKQIFRIVMTDGDMEVPYTINASPEVLRLQSEKGHIEICIDESEIIRIRGAGTGLQMVVDKPDSYDYAMKELNGMWQINTFSHNFKMMFRPIKGNINIDAPWLGENSGKITVSLLPDEKDKSFEMMIKEFTSSFTPEWPDYSFEDCMELTRRHFCNWLDKSPAVDSEYTEVRELAAYINWSSVVAPKGNFTRHTMLMSKNWMSNVWSWDHCFNAMALYNDMDRAWQQIMTIFDHQDEYGALPDFFSVSRCSFSFCKPPIHGLALKYIMKKRGGIDIKYLDEIYQPLCRWTDWWFNYRDDDRDGIPQYNHGNDSGWDNSTVFAKAVPVESPDLCAFLVIQMEALSEMALTLGKTEDAKNWSIRSENLIKKMIDEFWDGRKFVARLAYSHDIIDNDSLLVFIPIVLGKRLPDYIIQAMIAELEIKGKYMTRFGLATENVQSPFYVTDGYWRGPIWAPSTMLIVYGLMEAGALELARQLARSFCDMAAASGMAENYDAITGQGLRDRAYTWTSSVFLLLANELTETLKE